jgi:hypothetical protein
LAYTTVDLVAHLLTLDVQHRHREFRRWRVVYELRSVLCGFGTNYDVDRRREVQHSQQFGHVDVLGGQPAAKHVVGVGHHLDTHALQIGVQIARGQVDGLPGTERDPVQQHGSQHARVAGIPLAEFEHGLGLGREFFLARTEVVDRAFDHRGDQEVEIGLGRGDPGGEQRPQAVRVGLIGEQVDERIQVGHRQRPHQFDTLCRWAEAGECLELP